jgi:hypothetical protein
VSVGAALVGDDRYNFVVVRADGRVAADIFGNAAAFLVSDISEQVKHTR